MEISDLEEFERRMSSKIKDSVQRLKNQSLLSGIVNYSDENSEPGPDHALSEKIIFRKQRSFSIEREYRFAFALDKNAFDAYQVDYSVGAFNASPSKLNHARTLKIGGLGDICKLVPHQL